MPKIKSLILQTPEKQKAENAYTKFYNICRQLSTEQALYQHQLGEPDLVSLTSRPAKLIFKMYEHPSIQQRNLHGSILDHLPGIVYSLGRIYFNLIFVLKPYWPSNQQNDLGLLRSDRSVHGVLILLSPFDTQKFFTRFRSVIGWRCCCSRGSAMGLELLHSHFNAQGVISFV